MDHQLLPAPEGAPFEWLRECLNAAYFIEDDRRSAFRFGGASETATPVRPPSLPVQARRADERSKMSVYRSATLRWNDNESLCLIRNISAGGMMCRSMAGLVEGARVEVKMRSGDQVSGSVVWAREGQVGISFDERVNVATVLNPPERGDAPVQRMPRLAADCAATLIVNGARQGATLLDLSQGGAKIEAGFLIEGDEVMLGIAGLEPRRGIVRWAQGGRAGIAFHSPIAFNALARWAVKRSAQRVGTGSAPE